MVLMQLTSYHTSYLTAYLSKGGERGNRDGLVSGVEYVGVDGSERMCNIQRDRLRGDGLRSYTSLSTTTLTLDLTTPSLPPSTPPLPLTTSSTIGGGGGRGEGVCVVDVVLFLEVVGNLPHDKVRFVERGPHNPPIGLTSKREKGRRGGGEGGR